MADRPRPNPCVCPRAMQLLPCLLELAFSALTSEEPQLRGWGYAGLSCRTGMGCAASSQSQTVASPGGKPESIPKGYGEHKGPGSTNPHSPAIPAAKDLGELPQSDPVFSDNEHELGTKFAEKTGLARPGIGNMKHFNKRGDADRNTAASAATTNLFQKSTGIVPRCFVESIFATYDTDGNGTISVAELQPLAKDLEIDHSALHAALVGDGSPDKPVTQREVLDWFYNTHSLQQLRDMFSRLDNDDSGFIEFNEIPELLRICAEHITEENIEEAIASIDTDGDKKISFEEFVAWFNEDCKLVTYRSFFSIYARAEEGQEDRLGIEELKEMLVAMGASLQNIKAQEVMDKIDTNKNGSIELQEFITWAIKHN